MWRVFPYVLACLKWSLIRSFDLEFELAPLNFGPIKLDAIECELSVRLTHCNVVYVKAIAVTALVPQHA